MILEDLWIYFKFSAMESFTWLEFDIENATIGINYSEPNKSIADSFDNDTMNYCGAGGKSPISGVLVLLLYSLVAIVGIVGNSLVIFVVLKFK